MALNIPSIFGKDEENALRERWQQYGSTIVPLVFTLVHGSGDTNRRTTTAHKVYYVTEILFEITEDFTSLLTIKDNATSLFSTYLPLPAGSTGILPFTFVTPLRFATNFTTSLPAGAAGSAVVSVNGWEESL
jgi:hypothetical protein